MKCYLIPRSNTTYQCHWCEKDIPNNSPYIRFRRYYRTHKLHVACSKRLVQRGWLWELDINRFAGLNRTAIDSTSSDTEWNQIMHVASIDDNIRH